MTTYIFWYNHDDEEVVRVGPYLDTAAARDDYPQKPQDGLSRNFYMEFDDSARVTDLEAQLQQSRDDYETALREGEKTATLLRDAQHDANNAATLREAAEFARSERDRVEGENADMRNGWKVIKKLRAVIREQRHEQTSPGARKVTGALIDALTEALSIAGVERG